MADGWLMVVVVCALWVWEGEGVGVGTNGGKTPMEDDADDDDDDDPSWHPSIHPSIISVSASTARWRLHCWKTVAKHVRVRCQQTMLPSVTIGASRYRCHRCRCQSLAVAVGASH